MRGARIKIKQKKISVGLKSSFLRFFFFLLPLAHEQNQRRGDGGGGVCPRACHRGGGFGVTVGDHLVHGDGRNERAEAEVNRDPRTGRLHQCGQLLRFPDARLQLERGRRPDRGLDQHQQVLVHGQVATDHALSHQHVPVQGPDHRPDVERVHRRPFQRVHYSVHLFLTVEIRWM